MAPGVGTMNKFSEMSDAKLIVGDNSQDMNGHMNEVYMAIWSWFASFGIVLRLQLKDCPLHFSLVFY